MYTWHYLYRRNKVSFSLDLKNPDGLIGQTLNINIRIPSVKTIGRLFPAGSRISRSLDLSSPKSAERHSLTACLDIDLQLQAMPG